MRFFGEVYCLQESYRPDIAWEGWNVQELTGVDILNECEDGVAQLIEKLPSGRVIESHEIQIGRDMY